MARLPEVRDWDDVVRHGSVKLAVHIWAGGPRCVVLVHGYATNLMTWSPLVPSLLEAGFSVVAYDRRGHGHSSGADSYSIDDLAGDLRAVVDQLGLVRPILLGHSVGSWDVLVYAASGTDLAGIVCLDQAIAVDDPAWQSMYGPVTEERRSQLRADPFLAHGYTGAEVEQVINEAKISGRLQPWSAYGEMIRRNIQLESDGLYRVRPTADDRYNIELGWTTLVAEPYAAITCPITLALAARNTGPFHEALIRLAARRKLAAVLIDSDHDIHVERPGDVVGMLQTIEAGV